ncbi:MAG: hypothetical protein IID38_09245 [Planctomycetes bacterium]|nr:hypothetical protein [Planctomycetota bacterium]
MTERAIILATVTCATCLLANLYTRADSLRTMVDHGMIAPGSGCEFLNFGLY